MGFPSAFRHVQIRKHRREAGLLRAAGIDAEANLPGPFPHVADPHLGEMHPVLRALDAVVVLPAAEAIPHDLLLRRNGGGGPIGIAVVRDDGAQMLEGFVSTRSDHNIKFYWKISRKIKFTFRENDKMRLLSDFSMQRKNMLRKIDKCCILIFGVGLFVSPFLWWDVL